MVFRLFFIFISFTIFCSAEIHDSPLPLMRNLKASDFQSKITKQHMRELTKIEKRKEEAILVMSFNILFNLPDIEAQLDKEFHWKNRLPRIIEYFAMAKADIVGLQEPYHDQVQDLMENLSKEYAYYGVGREDGKEDGEVEAILYKKDRFTLLDGKTLFFSKTPQKPSMNSYRRKNALTYCKFKDRLTSKEFVVLNVHLSYSNMQARQYEAKFLKNFIDDLPKNMPVILTGDFNTFPMRYDLNTPFHDGEYVVKTITSGKMTNSRDRSVLGHIGNLSTTNFSSETQKSFSGKGTPGVTLDYIFVSEDVNVRLHAIDPARVNQSYMSDHFPVFAEVVIN